MNLFDILKSISFNKRDLTKQSDFNKEYNPFMVNRYLSMDPETLMIAEYVDGLSQQIPKDLQFEYYRQFIPKKNRFFKYLKKKNKADKNLKIIMEHFQCNEKLAQEYMCTMTKEELKTIIKLYQNPKGKIKKEN